MDARTQRLCAWCGPLMIVFWAVGFAVFAGFVPPPSPRQGPHEIAEMIRDHTNSIRLGLILTVSGSALLAPYIGLISMHMKRIEGPESPLSYAQLVLGACLILEFILPMMILQAATFRPDRADDTLQVLSDLAWIWFFGIASTIVVQSIIFGIVILQDHRSEPVLPRWTGYFNIWAGLLYSPGTVLVFFKDGPLAWNGVLVFWMPVGVFAVWLAVNTTVMIQSTNRRAALEAQTERAFGFPEGESDDAHLIHLLATQMVTVREQLARIVDGR